MAVATFMMRIPEDLKKKYEKISLGNLNDAKAEFPDYARKVIEKDLLRLEKEAAVFKKSA